MDGGLAVTLVSVAMFLGCFLLGFTPLLFRLSGVSVSPLKHRRGARGPGRVTHGLRHARPAPRTVCATHRPPRAHGREWLSVCLFFKLGAQSAAHFDGLSVNAPSTLTGNGRA